ncbi:MAG: ABC transporter ATP-binding protein/permease [Bacilli bacterium]|nr:ABC transporter ATP-binding protein/permease [Bacilli bacterium]
MLKLDNITKVYKTADNQVHALKGVSINFRKGEFVCVLGPSGCGKTTLLNIVGGLDHYTTGDLVIAGRSTKEFKSHDWDVYRNHEIGFVFQSYNLIPHQNILQNVALALTIGGVSKHEREERAKRALDNVGLKGLYKKMPNQLSGGQCQRVAIARALVNEPSILLADEPTGALDSVTSVQIMDLIKEIARDRLVIMVTHNPDLAEKYATRIIKLHDGEVIDDSNPFADEDELKEVQSLPVKEENKKAKMSLMTAFRLSAMNLFSKRKRTALVIIASSIGIVGTSAVLAVSNGVRGYINSTQEDLISGNPVKVSESAFDIASIIESMSSVTASQTVVEGVHDGKIDVEFIIKSLIEQADLSASSLISNVITEDYMSFLDGIPDEYISAINKSYGIAPKNNVYTTVTVDALDDNGKQTEIDVNYSLSALVNVCGQIVKQTDYASYASQIENYAGTFTQLMDSKEYILSQYDIVEGTYPEGESEMLLVLNSNGTMNDFTLAGLGFYSQANFLNAIYKFIEDEQYYDDERWQGQQSIEIADILNKEFHYYPDDTVFTKTSFTSRPFEYTSIARDKWGEGLKMKITGILRPKEGVNYGCLNDGIYYTTDFTRRFIADNMVSEMYEYLTTAEEQTISSQVIYQPGSTLPIVSGITYDVNIVYQGNEYSAVVPFGSKAGGLQSLMSGFFGGSSSLDVASYSLRQAGGAALPNSISIYPKSFDAKDKVTAYLDDWNGDGPVVVNDKSIAKADREEINYTDNLTVILMIVNSMIDIVTTSLIVFTSLSLVVSVVMIAVITYVSVMERIKEIGVIRAMGGRKRDVSALFNAETGIIGFASGLFGVAVTYVLEVILNVIIKALFGISMIADLAPLTAVMIIIVSILLTAISGLVPASSAASKDPVVALRTE